MMNKIPKEYQDLLDEFPFLTLIKYGGNEYVGIIQNMDNNLASMYNFENIKDTGQTNMIFGGGGTMMDTNRMIPINIIFKSNFEKFRSCLLTFSIKDFEVLHGPTISLNNIIQKRVKRRNIQLVRRM